MSTSTLSLTKTRELITKFVKKYRASLIDGVNRSLTDEFIEDLESASLQKFFEQADRISTYFGAHFSLFNTYKQNGTTKVTLWIGAHANANDLTKKISGCKDTDELLKYFQDGGSWYNISEARLAALEVIFDHLGVKTYPTKTTSKVTTKKTAKKPEVVTISDTTKVQNEIAFINFDADKFDHALHAGGNNFDPMIDNASENCASNQIDHAINAFKLAKKEIDAFITELAKAKDAGAKYVVDSSWCERKDFDFEK